LQVLLELLQTVELLELALCSCLIALRCQFVQLLNLINPVLEPKQLLFIPVT